MPGGRLLPDWPQRYRARNHRNDRHFPGAINHHHRGKGVDGEEPVKAVCKYDRGARLILFQIALHKSFIFVTVDGQKKNICIRLKVRTDVSKQWFQRVARAAPSGPEIEDKNFPSRILQREGRAFGGFPEHEISGFAGVRIFLRLCRDRSLRDFIVSEEQILA